MRGLMRYISLWAVLICWNVFPADAALKDAEEFYLDNGLQVVVIPNHKAPIIKQIVLYKAGRVDEPAGKGGIAHLLEHLMFRGTKKFSDGHFERLIMENGGLSNAATTHDYTFYHQFLSVDRLELAMYLEADRMSGLKINDAVFTTERDIVFQERRQRLNANTTRLFWEKYGRLFRDGSLYGEPVSGRGTEILSITKQDVRNFYERFYRPDNAVLILSGDIDVETAHDLAQKYYGKISSRPMSEKNTEALQDMEDAIPSGYELRAARADVNLGRLAGSYLLPKFGGDDVSLYALIVLSNYLSGSANSPVQKKIVRDKHLAASAGTSFEFLSRGESSFLMYAYFADTADAEKIKKEFMTALNETAQKLTAKELEKVKKRILARRIYADDNPRDAADIMAQWLGAGYSLADMQSFERQISRIKVGDVLAAVEDLQKRHPFWGILTPLTEVKK